ncbi:MAG: polysaccharide biosynthesis/export family protein [Pyrinomonadaceae bacterium]
MDIKYLLLVIVLFLFVGPVCAQAPVGLQVNKSYQLGPGDEIAGKVLGEPGYDFTATVNEDGNIELAFSPDQPIVAKCKTERELRDEISRRLGKYLKNPYLTVQVTKRNSRPPVSIYGEVRTQGQVLLMRKTTLVELLAFSGGAMEDAGGTIQVFRTQPPLCAESNDDQSWRLANKSGLDVHSQTYNLADVVMGKEDSNPIIYPGDVISVPKAKVVYMTGEVVAPQAIYLKEGGLTLSVALAKVSGVRREAKTKNIKIQREKPGTNEREIISVNYDQIKAGKGKDIMLQPNDIVGVDVAKESIGLSVLKMVIGTGKTALFSLGQSIPPRVLY